MASQKNTDVHLEAVEAAENEGFQPKEIGNARLVGIPKREHSERLLGCCWQWYLTTHHHKRKTCTPWIL